MPYEEIEPSSARLLETDAGYARAHPGRFLLFARLHPGPGGGAEELLERAVRELGFVGLKLHPVGSHIAPTDPRTVSLVRKAAQLGVPTLFHCGGRGADAAPTTRAAGREGAGGDDSVGTCGRLFPRRECLGVGQALSESRPRDERDAGSQDVAAGNRYDWARPLRLRVGWPRLRPAVGAAQVGFCCRDSRRMPRIC